MSTSDTIAFPHPILTPINGKPTNTTLQLLQRQLFTNARAITSPRGGGLNGHLAILLDNATYFARAGTAFDIPVHPGAAPEHIVGATAAQIAETTRLYNQGLYDIRLYTRVATALQAQLLAAVDNTFLRALEDPDFGYADVTPRQMLDHLKTNYGILTPEELELNRSALSHPWNPEAPLELFWANLANIRRVALTGGAPISDVTAITLTLAMFEKSGLLATTTEKFRLRPVAEWTMATFKADFDLGNQERVRKLTAGTAGYHGAHSATVTPPPTVSSTPTPIAAAATSTAPPPPTHVSVEGGKMYYCWTHGLSANQHHTSGTCERKASGHKDNATAFHMQGGNNKISSGARPRQLPSTRT